MALTKSDRNKKYRSGHLEFVQKLGREHYAKHKKQYKINCAKNRGLGWIELIETNPFEDTDMRWEWHHVDDIFVIPVPYSVHHSAQNNPTLDLTHREIVNAWIKTCYDIDIEEIKRNKGK